MYLLNPCFLRCQQRFRIFHFTFHNVSIKSNSNKYLGVAIFDFTFHNVSIKSEFTRKLFSRRQPLHSTMYLLNPGRKRQESISNIDFTFHNVSIKSEELTGATLTYWPLHSTMYLLNLALMSFDSAVQALYIPQCIY